MICTITHHRHHYYHHHHYHHHDHLTNDPPLLRLQSPAPGDTLLAMNDLSRIGVAIEANLLARFDRLIERRGYPSRSEAFRDLIRDALMAESAQAASSPVVGSVTLVYDHHVRQLTAKLTALQHQFHGAIVSTLHVHLDHDNCLEVIVVRGKARDVRRLADALISTKGVRHGQLTIAASPLDTPHGPHAQHAPHASHGAHGAHATRGGRAAHALED